MLSAADKAQFPPVLPGFESINRYWDKFQQLPAAKILPGEYYVTRNNEVIATVLGSCVSACVRDPLLGIGGMNHFMLPLSTEGKGWGGIDDVLSTATRYGNYAMEHMINDILKIGGSKKRLEAKIFGGGIIIENLSDVGKMNIAFVREYLDTENIPLASEDVGDIYPRKVLYIPRTGKVLVKRIRHLHNDTVVRRESEYQKEISYAPVAGEIELFD